MSNRFQCGGWNGGACGGESELEGGKRWWHDLELEVTHGLSLLSPMNPILGFLCHSPGERVKKCKEKRKVKERISDALL